MKSHLISQLLRLGCAAIFVFLTAPQAGNASETEMSCSDALQKFVEEIDRVLLSNPGSLFIVLPVVAKLETVEHCNVDEAIAISKGSKFFRSIYEQRTMFAVSFSSSGYDVSFGVRKADGKIELPHAKVRK